MIDSGTASSAPIGPHIQVQNASARNTKSGLSVSRRPTMVGVMKCPSAVVSAMSPSGAMKAWPSEGKRDEADAEQHDHHHGRADIGHVVQQPASKPKITGLGKPISQAPTATIVPTPMLTIVTTVR